MVEGLSEKGVTVIPVSIGNNFDPEELKTIASDSKNIFPQDAVDSVKRAVKDAASLAPPGVNQGKKKIVFGNFVPDCIPQIKENQTRLPQPQCLSATKNGAESEFYLGFVYKDQCVVNT